MFENEGRPAYTYRKSKNTLTRMSAVRLGPAVVDLVVHPRELVQDGGRVFAEKLAGAFRDAPQSLCVNLTAAAQLTEAGLAVLRSAERHAQERGIAFTLRPSSACAWRHLEALGLRRAVAA